MQPRFQMLINGLELQQSDVNLLGQVSALADDAVFAEWMRLIPFSSSASKAILPYGNAATVRGVTTVSNNAGNPASGTVLVNPFRALVGSRAAVGAGAAANWSDFRSCVYVGSTTALSAAVSLGANSSGNPRWDLVYAAVTVDGNGTTVSRYYKDPTTKAVGNVFTAATLVTTVTIGVQAGTPAASPTYPNAPSDAAGVYYIPLAYVRVPNGFTATSTVAIADINEVAPVLHLARTTGAMGCAPANQSHGSVSSAGAMVPGNVLTRQPFSASTLNYKPNGFIPPSIIGCESIFLKVNTKSGQETHLNGDIVDSSRDWRGRWFIVHAHSGDNLSNLASDNPAAAFPHIPSSLNYNAKMYMSNSFAIEAPGIVNAHLIFYVDNTQFAGMAASTNVGLYVDSSNGNLRYYQNGSPGTCFFIWLMATGPMPT